jgi:hypothetical protein
VQWYLAVFIFGSHIDLTFYFPNNRSDAEICRGL